MREAARRTFSLRSACSRTGRAFASSGGSFLRRAVSSSSWLPRTRWNHSPSHRGPSPRPPGTGRNAGIEQKARTLSAAASRTPASLSPRSLTSVGTAFSTKKPFLSCRAASRRAAADSADSCRCNFRKPSSSSSAWLAAGMAHKTAETIPRRKKLTWRRFMRGSSCWGPHCPSLLSHPTDRRAPRRMPDHNQHALYDNRLCHVQALVALAPGEADGAQHAGRASRLDEDATVNLIGGATGHEHEAAGAGLDANRVEARYGG